MDKIVYRFVYNRKNRLNGTGKALVQLEALQLLAKYSGTEEEFFRMRSNSNVNKHLEMLAAKAGIEKHISFHTARHTHATLLIYSGVNITTVQRLLGHRSVKTTQGYTDVMDETVILDLQQHQLPPS